MMTASARKTLNTPLIAALVALLALAIATVIVILNKDDTDGGNGAPSTTGPTTSGGGDSSGSTEVTAPDLGVRYNYVTDGYEANRWKGPRPFAVGGESLESAMSYDSCTPDSGSDVIYGLIKTSSTDLESAATETAKAWIEQMWKDGTATTPTNPVQKNTKSGLQGQLVEVESSLSTPEPKCNTKTIHIATFATSNAAGETVVMVASYRTDGKIPKPLSDIEKDVAATMTSLSNL